jgi:hypothetical protein
LRISPLAVLVLLSAAVLAGSASAAGPALTASEYRAKANAICTELNNYAPPSGTLANQFAALLAKARSSLRALEKLEPPSTLAPTHRQVTQLITKGLGTFDSLLARLRSGQLTESHFRAAVGRVSSEKEDALWKKLGAKVCAQP